MKRLAGVLLAAWLGSASGTAWADEAAALVPRLALPPVAATRNVIAALPQVLAARSGVGLAQARGQQLAVGPHEWVLKAGAQQRSESVGPRYTEGELALERSLRWGNKAQTDRELGQAGIAVGHSAYADVWHEVVRSLVQSWFEWQRGRSATLVLSDQAALAQAQLDVTARRVKAGEAPRMEQLMAQAELDRTRANQQQARGREQVLHSGLQKRFPGLSGLDAPAQANAAPGLVQLPDDAAVWVKRVTEDNHELELVQAQLLVARLQSERAGQDSRPDPLLGVRAARERGGQENIVGVYLAIPLSGSHRQAGQRAALALLEAAEQRLIQTRVKVEADAQAVVLQAGHNVEVWQRLSSVQQSMAEVAQLAVKAYGLGEITLTESLQTRRAALEAALAAEAARWDMHEAISRVLVDAHLLWPADEDKH